MSPLLVHALSVVGIYYFWRVYAHWQVEQKQALRERVAYMLWTAANRCA